RVLAIAPRLSCSPSCIRPCSPHDRPLSHPPRLGRERRSRCAAAEPGRTMVWASGLAAVFGSRLLRSGYLDGGNIGRSDLADEIDTEEAILHGDLELLKPRYA